MAVLVGYGPRMTEAKRRPRKGAVPPPSGGAARPGGRSRRPPRRRTGRAADAGTRTPRSGAAARVAARALAKPPVRKLAKDLGVDLADVAGSGEGGIISRADVDRHAAGRAGAAPTGRPARRRHPARGRGADRASGRRASRSRACAR